MGTENVTEIKCLDLCLYFVFKEYEDSHGYGTNWFCKLHKKRITGSGCNGKDYIDATNKTMGVKHGSE